MLEFEKVNGVLHIWGWDSEDKWVSCQCNIKKDGSLGKRRYNMDKLDPKIVQLVMDNPSTHGKV